MKALIGMLLVLGLCPLPGLAQQIYAGHSAAGEASFSDQPLPGHELIELEVAPAPQSRAAARATTAQVLELANELAANRRARERAADSDRSRRDRRHAGVRSFEQRALPYRERFYPARRFQPAQRRRPPAVAAPGPLPQRQRFEPAFRPTRAPTP